MDHTSFPADPSERADWLEARENEIATKTVAALTTIVTGAFDGYLKSLTAAGDLATLDGIPDAWLTFVTNELLDDLGATYMAGSVTAWIGAAVTDTNVATLFERVVNANAASFMATATNRLKGVGDSTWNLIRTQIQNDIATGATIEQTTTRLRAVADFSASRAETIARTETIGAFINGDMAGAQALGDKGPIEKVWRATSDDRTRPSHVEANGQCVPFAENFAVGGVAMSHPHADGAPASEVVNCLLEGETALPVGALVSMSRAWWEGEAIQLITADGVRLRVTPNHPVLTPSGWKAAQSLQAGDNVLRIPLAHEPDDEHRPPTVEELYRACCLTGDPVVVSSSRVDFHGDRPTSDVEVVRPDSELWHRVGWEHRLDISLDGLLNPEGLGAGDSRGERTAQRVGLQMITGATSPTTRRVEGQVVVTAPPSFVRGARPGATFLWSEPSSAEQVGFAGRTNGQPEPSQPEGDGVALDAEALSHRQHGRPVSVQSAKLVQVDRVRWAGHVYNLHSETGLLYSEGALHSNCRCYVEFLYDGDARPDGTKVVRQPGTTVAGPVSLNADTSTE